MNGLGWSDIKEDLQASSKERLSGLQSLETLLRQANLGKAELGELLSLSPGLLSDANSKVAQQTLEALTLVVQRADTPVLPYAHILIPSVVERLGDSRQPVRANALDVLVSLFQALKPEFVLDKLAPYWQHKNWRIKHGLLEVIAEVVSGTGAAFLGGRDQNNAVVKQIVCMMDEPELIIRETAMTCLGEIYNAAPAAVVSTVQASGLKPAQQMEVLGRLGALDAASNVSASDLGPRRPSSGYVADDTASIDGSAPHGFYATSEYTVTTSARVSGSGRAGQTAPHSDAAPSRPAEGRRQQSTSSAGPSSAPAAAAAATKRGGFKDGGGVTLDGELPAAEPVPITSERELREELEAATATLSLAPNTEWQARMAAMQRVEGLVLGGATEYECFHEAMKGLAQVLTQQFKERRSTIARQTCHLIGVLARALGPRFEQYALTLLPTLFGVIVITVAVMAESADVGVRGMLRHCQTTRILQAISDGVCKEKNPKTRQYCASYLILILEEWDVAVWSRQLEAVEAAIRAAAQDSSADTRQSGRTAMALYNSALPDRAQAFLRRLDSGLQDKLSAALSGPKAAKPPPSTISRQSISAAMAAKKARQAAEAAESDAGIVVMVPGASKPERRPDSLQPASQPSEPSTAPRQRAASRSSNAAFFGSAPSSSQSATGEVDAPSRGLTGAAGRTSRKSLALPPGRIPGGSADLTGLLGEPSNSLLDSTTQARLRKPRMSLLPSEMPQRVPAPAGPPAGPPATPAMRAEPAAAARVPCAQTPEVPPSRPPVVPATAAPSTSARSSSTWERGNAVAETGTAATGSPGLVPLSRVVSTFVGGPRTWSDKVEALSALDSHVRASVSGVVASPGKGSYPDDSAQSTSSLFAADPDKVVSALERVRERLLDALEDPHQKVLAAALALVGSIIRHYGRVLEGQLDRLLPVLLNKVAEGKEQARASCSDVMNACGQMYRADILVPALSKCLDLVKLPRSKQMALEFFRAHVGQWTSINPTQLKHWLVRLAPLLDDRTPELRKRAGEVLDSLLALPWAREPINYVAYQHNNPDVAPLRRHLMSLPAGIPPVSTGASTSGAGNTLTVTGVAPASTSDTRRQVSSAAPAAPVASAQSLPPFVIHRHTGSGGNSGQAGAAEARANMSPPPTRPLPQGQDLSPAPAASFFRPYGGPLSPIRAPVNAYVFRGGSLAPSPAKPGTPGMRLPGTPGSRRALQVPADPVAQATLMAQLLDTGREALSAATEANAGDGVASFALGRHTAAMESLADAVERCSREAWVRTFPQLMVEFNSWVHHPISAVRSMAFSLLRELLTHQPHLFSDNNLESHIGLLLNGCGDGSREVSTPASQTYSVLLSSCNATQALLILRQLMPREREAHQRAGDLGTRLVAVMEGTRQLAARLEPSELHRLAFSPDAKTGKTLLEGLVANLTDSETCVRRGAVIALAFLWFRLGHSVRDVLQVCAPQSYNLLCVYYLKLHGVATGDGRYNATEHPLVLGPAPPPAAC